MALHGPVDRLDPAQAADVVELAARAAATVGHSSVGDGAWHQRVTGDGGGFAAAWSDDASSSRAASTLTAYLQAVRSVDGRWTAELLVDPAHRTLTADVGASLLSTVLRQVGAAGGGVVDLWAVAATPSHAEVAARAGLVAHRTLLQMVRPLPTGVHADLVLRPFVVGRDEDEVLSVNRRAFVRHPDQGDMSRADLDERKTEPWFDPAGFLLHDIGGRLAGFCWTKLFPAAPDGTTQGEIHVICVDPDFHGRGLGRDLTVAGLDHLSNRGATEGMLFVEGDNAGAIRLYEKLGFTVIRTDRSFRTTVAAT